MGHRRWELIGSPGVILPFHQKMLCGLGASGACGLVGWTSSARLQCNSGQRVRSESGFSVKDLADSYRKGANATSLTAKRNRGGAGGGRARISSRA